MPKEAGSARKMRVKELKYGAKSTRYECEAEMIEANGQVTRKIEKARCLGTTSACQDPAHTNFSAYLA
jgi:hypothetical protein